MSDRLNLLFVFADQWRAAAFGLTADPNAHTPNLDAFARDNIVLTNAVSGCPVCTPYRACLMTGQYAHTHELIANDQCLAEHSRGPFLAAALNAGGYATAYFGKWHLDGHGRGEFVPPDWRLGFTFWQGYECNHDYQHGFYYEGDDPTRHEYSGYDAAAQTDNVCAWLRARRPDEPFACFLSWGPPHAPFGSAPPEFEAMFDPETVALRPNVPTDDPAFAAAARRDLAGYYAHGAALDACWGRLMAALDDTGLAENTVVIFTSDHGDMLGSQGRWKKQVPWAESVDVPFYCRHPHAAARQVADILDSPDLMPTLLGLLDVPIPGTVQGRDLSVAIRTGRELPRRPALLACYLPFHQWKYETGGFEYRGLRDERWTYTRNLDGPWLLYDNRTDPGQRHNLVQAPECRAVVAALEAELSARLAEIGDAFLPGPEYIRRFHIPLNAAGDVYYW